MAKQGGNPDNFKPISADEARKRGKAGGIASARARQQRRAMRDTAEILLKMPMRDGAIDNISGIESLAAIAKNQGQDVNLTLQDMILVATIRKAMKGDIRAVEFIQSLMGETAEKAQVSPLDTLAESIKQYEDQDDDRDTHIR